MKNTVTECNQNISIDAELDIVTEILGSFDLLAIAPVMDLVSIRKLIAEVKKAPSVQRVEIACINDVNFPINSSFGRILSRKSLDLATA